MLGIQTQVLTLILSLKKGALKVGDRENGASSTQEERPGKEESPRGGRPQPLYVIMRSVSLMYLTEMGKKDKELRLLENTDLPIFGNISKL